jgi:hypothetical protein
MGIQTGVDEKVGEGILMPLLDGIQNKPNRK